MIRSILAGCGAYLPERVVSNTELAAQVDTSDSWIADRTGIANRHIAAEGETTADLAARAAERTLAAAGMTAAPLCAIPKRRCISVPDRHRPGRT